MDDQEQDDGEDEALEQGGAFAVEVGDDLVEARGQVVEHVAGDDGHHDKRVAGHELRQDVCVEVGEDLLNHFAKAFERRGAEDGEAEHHQAEHHGDVDHAQGPRANPCLRYAPHTFEGFVDGQKQAVVSAPEQVHPARAVPQAAEHHGEDVVEVGAKFAVAVATEGNVEVVAQPCGEGDVPAAPEVRRVLRFERRVEVLLELITEQQRQADGHVGVAREVAIELEGEAEPAEQILHAGVEHGVVEHAVDEVAADVVGDDYLLDEAGHD